MTSTPRLPTIALGLALGVALTGSDVATAAAAAAPPAPAGRDAHVTRATLANGLRVVIVRDTLAPMVTTQITYLAGSYEAPPGFPGTAHALEHMLFRDSEGLTGAQLNAMTGKMGADNNAFTTHDATQYFFAAPAQYLDLLLRIEALRMRGARLTDTDWELEKGAIEQEVSRDISDPGYLAFQDAQRILYAGTGYAEDALGSRPSFDATTGKVLRDFYDKWYQPGNAILVIVGDVDPDATLARVKQLFDPIPKGEAATPAPLELQPFSPKTLARNTPDATGTVQYLFRMPGQRSKDHAAMQVLLDVLNNPRSGLSDLAARGKVLSADAWSQPFVHGGVGVVEVGFPKGGSGGKARRQLDGVIDRLLRDGVPADLVEAAKRQEQAQFEFSRNSPTTLAEAWSQALAWQGLASPQEALDQILAVTPADVDRVARACLAPDQRITVVLTPDANGKRPPESAGFGGTESLAGDDKLDTPLPEWATRQLATLQLPRWTLAPVRMTLANGITLIVQPTAVSRTVTVQGRVDGNESLQAPPGQEGVGRLLDSLFDYGTTGMDRDAFHAALDEIAATESAGSSFRLAVPSAGFERGMQLLADNQLHPALPEAAFAIQRQTLADTLAGELESPHYRMKHALLKGLLPAGDPGLREATPKTVGALALADVKAYYAKVFRPDMTTIVVVGDVTPAQARAVVEKAFGGWKASGPKPDVVPKPVASNPPSYTVVRNGYASQDQVTMGQMLDLDVDDPARYALQLGNEVLGGNGFASRLMLDIRVRHGYAYGAGSLLDFDRSRATLYVYYGSDPDKVQPVDRLVMQNLDAMRNSPVSADELLNARQARIRSIPLEVSSVENIARSLLDWSIKGEPLDEPMVAARHYLELTAPEIQAAFRKYVQPGRIAQVVQGPAPKRH